MATSTKKNPPKPFNRKAVSVLDGGLSEKTMQGMKANAKKQGMGDGQPPPLKRATQPKREVLYPDIEVKVYDGEGAMKYEEAMALLGWEVVDEGAYKLLDVNKAKVNFRNNATNRPFRAGMAKRYMLEILRKVWYLNGETMVFDKYGFAQSAQHRLAGFILAVQAWRKEGGSKGKWGKYWKTEPRLECIVVWGIDPKPEIIRTLDQGQKRTYGDCIYQSGIFGDGTHPVSLGEGKDQVTLPAMGDKLKVRLSNILAGATRLVWLRQGGKTVSDAPNFPVSEGMQFIEDHPKLIYAVARMLALEGGSGQGGNRITKFLTLAYASALWYLMAASHTDPSEYATEGAAALDFKNEKKANEFWAAFASGANLDADNPIHVVREMVRGVDAGSPTGRDEIVCMIARAFNHWMDGKKVKPRDIAIRRTTDSATGKVKLAEWPRLGGIDQEEPDKPVASELEVNPPDTEREGSRAGKKWAEGDTAWVKTSGGDPPWFGVIKDVPQVEKGVEPYAVLLDADSGDDKEWEEPLTKLCLSYPK